MFITETPVFLYVYIKYITRLVYSNGFVDFDSYGLIKKWKHFKINIIIYMNIMQKTERANFHPTNVDLSNGKSNCELQMDNIRDDMSSYQIIIEL